MTISTLVFLILGKRVTLRGKNTNPGSHESVDSLKGMVRLIKKVHSGNSRCRGYRGNSPDPTMVGEMSFPKAAYYGVFFMLFSAFCNAGFDLFRRIQEP